MATEDPIKPSPLPYYAARLALTALGALHTATQHAGRLFSYLDDHLAAPVRNAFTRLVSLPVYRIFFFTQLRIRKTVASTRGLFFVFFTSKYTLHILLVVFAVPIAFAQLEPASAAADVGQHSILYALVTNGQESVIEETARQESPEAPTSYLDGTVQPLAKIDFDYDLADATDRTTDHGIAGTVALRPRPSRLDLEGPVTRPEPEPVLATTIAPEAPSEPRTEISAYTVRPGDTIAAIARRHGISTNTVLWANGLTATSRLRPGDTLKLLPVSGVLHTVKRGETLAGIAKQYAVSATELAAGNGSVKTLRVGTELVIPGGTPLPTRVVVATAPKPEPTPVTIPKPATAPTPSAPKPASVTVPASTAKTPKVTSAKGVRSDIPIARIKNKAFDIYQELSNYTEDARPQPEEEIVDTAAQSKTKLLWPTTKRVINQYYGWNHTGVDLDGDYTDFIIASADGVVKEAGWNNGGYGLQMVIDHDGGFRTRYAHASKIFVKAGDTVKRGEVIGYVGTTGRSTGTHLHYEVYVGGKRKNPLAYIK